MNVPRDPRPAADPNPTDRRGRGPCPWLSERAGDFGHLPELGTAEARAKARRLAPRRGKGGAE